VHTFDYLFGVPNEETTACPTLFVWRGLRQPLPEFRAEQRHFG
jgi:hypothetical protein